MPRYPRIVAPNLFYHLMNRGIEKRSIFRQPQDYAKFMAYLLKYKEKFDWSVYCYCLLPNHFHLFVQTRKHPLALIMKSLQTAYGVYFNKKYKRVGPLFSDRFKSIICGEDEYFLQVSKYIHLNPVRAKLCSHPANYPYSSYREYIYENSRKKEYSLLDKREMKRILGDKITKKSRNFYRAFVEEREDFFDYNPEDTKVDIFGDDKFVTKFRRIGF